MHNLSSQHVPTVGGPAMTFDGFISYSHAADGRLAPAVQRGLHRLAKPWHRRRALWIFRDQTGLAVTPGLWSSIQTALDGSEYFVLLSSPEAAQSPWVNREIEHWITTKSADRVLPVVTDGEWAWDDDRGDFTEDSTAVPPALRGVFTEEPFFLDLRWARGSEHLSLHHSRFRDAIAQLAAPMHGISKDDLEGEDVRQHRRAKRLRSGAAATLVVLALLASITGMSAVRNAERAKAAAAEALRQQQVANSQRDSAERSAAEARRQQQLAQQEQTRAAQASAAADASEQSAQEQQRLADQAAVEARRQRKLADQASDRTQEQQRLAKEASERAQALQKEADRLAKVAAEQRRLADEAAAEAAKQQAKADQQQRVAVSRRLMNQAAAALVDDPRTALMLGTAAQQLSPDPATRGQLTGFLTSTNYAGVIGNVTRAAYGSNGLLAALGSDNRIALWNVADPQRPVRMAVLPEPAAADVAPQFSPDGRTLAVKGAQNRAVLWDVTDRSHPARIATLANGSQVTAMEFSRDGGSFVVGDGHGTTYLWDMTDRTDPALLATIAGYGNYPVMNLAISPNGRLLIVDEGRFTPIYDLTDPAYPEQVDGFLPFGAAPMAFSPDGSSLAVAGDGSVYLYNVTSRYDTTSRAPLRTALEDDPPADQVPPPPLPSINPDDEPYDRLTGLNGLVRSLTYSADGNLLVAGDQNGVAAIWDQGKTRSPGVLVRVQAHGPINSLSFDPKAGVLVTADASATTTLWNVTPPGAPSPLATLAVPDGRARATAFSTDGRTLIAAGSAAMANTWNITRPSRPVRGADLALSYDRVRAVAFTPDRRTVAAVNADSGILRMSGTSPSAPKTNVTVLPNQVMGTNALAFSPDGRTLAVVADAATLMLWDVADRAQPVLRYRLSGAFGMKVAFSPDGRTLATTSSTDPTVTLWNVADLSAPVRLATLVGHSDIVYALAFRPDGHILATGSADHTVILWDVTDRAHPDRTATLTGHSSYVYAVAFSPDGHTLASGGGDYTVILSDTTNPVDPVRIATTKTALGAQVASLAFRPDGRTLAVTGQRSDAAATVTLWNLAKLNSLRADPGKYACAVIGRGLTAAEWSRFIPEIKYQRTCPK
jgi:WD40 repeat protein